MVYGLFSEPFSNWVLGVPWMDARAHAVLGSRLAQSIEEIGWSAFLNHFKVGNRAYQCYCALVYSCGASIHTLTIVNGFLAFWGGLILVRSLSGLEPLPVLRDWVVLLIVFCPSVVFWCTVNLKEAPMYWAICSVFSQAFPAGGVTGRLSRWALFVAGAILGLLLRPIVIVGWLLAVAGAGLLRRGFRMKAALIVLALPLIVSVVQLSVGAPITTESALDIAETHMRGLSQISDQTEVEHVFGKPVFLVSGAMAVFFMPFPWQVTSLRLLLSVIETWGMTLLLVWAWFGNPRHMIRSTVKKPAVIVAASALAWMCVLLSYYPNLGLMARQRVQVIPALLALIVIPVALSRGHILKTAISQWILRQRSESTKEPSSTKDSDAVLGRG
jgi:hypothetical protein